ncbi:hypothetical protein GCM10028822_40130 [Hymenobacter terrigena]
MTKRNWSKLLIAFIVLDIALTYWQNYQLQLDGDLVNIVLPSPGYSKVLHDPFGWSVFTRNEIYAGTNRFFAHGTMYLYWRQLPRLLQHFMSAIDSLYVSSAIFNTAVQTLLVFVLAAYVRQGTGAPRGSWGYWLAAALLVPLFQTEGFYGQMGITNQAITYTFFYAFPILLLLLLFWPFFQAAQRQQPLRLPWWRAGLLVLLMVVISFNGPIATAAIAVLLLGIGLYWAWLQWHTVPTSAAPRTLAVGWLSGQAMWLLAILAILSIYSLYIGRNNIENSHTYTLSELYKLLPTGVYKELWMQWALPMLLLLLVINGQLIRWLIPPAPDRNRVLLSLRAVGLFSVLFILLLPFGGYRSYRPYLIRGDSILPVLIGLIYAYGLTTYFLLFHLRGLVWRGYVATTVVFLGIFTYTDAVFQMPRTNDCERWAFAQMADSPEPVVHIYASCNLLSWGMMSDYNASDQNADMLYYWGVTNSKKLYYQQ